MTTKNEKETAAEKGEETTTLKTCHPSVCVGGAQPSSCACPITPKK